MKEVKAWEDDAGELHSTASDAHASNIAIKERELEYNFNDWYHDDEKNNIQIREDKISGRMRIIPSEIFEWLIEHQKYIEENIFGELNKVKGTFE